MTDRHPSSAHGDATLDPAHKVPARANPGQTAGPPPAATDWRGRLLAGVRPQPPAPPAPNRVGWPGYVSRPAVWWGDGTVAGARCVAAVWEFGVYGGSFGEVDAATFAAAAEHAAKVRLPLLSFLRSGGTRLQEGVAGLVGLSRATLAAAALAEAGVPHLAIVDHPTTGGVWVTVASGADLRCAVAGATVGFAGPRVVAAATGADPGPASHTAASAHAAGLVDTVVEPDQVEGWLATALAAATATVTRLGGAAPGVTPPDAPRRGGWEQVRAARAAGRTTAGEVLDALLPAGVELAGGDPTTRARLGLLAAPTTLTPTTLTPAALTPAALTPAALTPAAPPAGAVAVALAARAGGAPGPAGFRLLARAARLAGKLGLPLVTLIDTPGADPSPAAEAGGVAAAIGTAMAAVLACPTPTVCVVVGEGGSGGALAGACADVLLMAPDSYLTALVPEGAAATLRIPPERAADLGGLHPADLRRLGFADGLLTTGEPAAVAAAVIGQLAQLIGGDPAPRLATRRRRWSTELPGRL